MNGSTHQGRNQDTLISIKNENKNTTIQNSVGHWESNPRGKFIALQAYLKKQEKAQINNLTLLLKELEKEKQTRTKVIRRKEIIKIRAQINELESKNDAKDQ